MTLRDLAYSPIFGLPLMLWIGVLSMLCFLSAATIMILNLHTKVRISVDWHKRMAITGLVMMIIHAILASSAYF